MFRLWAQSPGGEGKERRKREAGKEGRGREKSHLKSDEKKRTRKKREREETLGYNDYYSVVRFRSRAKTLSGMAKVKTFC